MSGVLIVFTSPLPYSHPAFAAVQDMVAQSKTCPHRFTFLNAPFAEGVHPLTLRAFRASHPEYTLESGWNEIERFCDTRLLPALEAGKRVVMSSFDFDLFLCVMHAQENASKRIRLSGINYAKVREVLRERGMPFPIYLGFEGKMDEDFVMLRDAQELRKRSDHSISSYLHERAYLIRAHFDRREENMFHNLYTGGGISIQTLAERAYAFITQDTFVKHHSHSSLVGERAA